MTYDHPEIAPMEKDNNTTPRKKGKPGLWRPVLLILAIVAVLVLARVFGIGQKLGAIRDWIRSLGPLGPVAYVVIYIGCVIAALPGSAISIAGGALFGTVVGVILVSIASTLGASLAFLMGRYFARDAVVRWLADKEKFRRLDRLTEEHGAIIVALTRLVPLFPFNLLNYGFGLTRVPFWTYVFWSWLCMLPGTVLYIAGADAVFKGVARGEVPWLLVGVVVLAAVILTLLVRHARKKLREKEQTAGLDQEPAGQEVSDG